MCRASGGLGAAIGSLDAESSAECSPQGTEVGGVGSVAGFLPGSLVLLQLARKPGHKAAGFGYLGPSGHGSCICMECGEHWTQSLCLDFSLLGRRRRGGVGGSSGPGACSRYPLLNSALSLYTVRPCVCHWSVTGGVCIAILYFHTITLRCSGPVNSS